MIDTLIMAALIAPYCVTVLWLGIGIVTAKLSAVQIIFGFVSVFLYPLAIILGYVIIAAGLTKIGGKFLAKEKTHGIET